MLNIISSAEPLWSCCVTTWKTKSSLGLSMDVCIHYSYIYNLKTPSFSIKGDLQILKCLFYSVNHIYILLSQGWRTVVICPQYALTCLALSITLLWNQMCPLTPMLVSRQKCGRSFFKTAAYVHTNTHTPPHKQTCPESKADTFKWASSPDTH